MYQRSILSNGLRVLTAPMQGVKSVAIAFFVGIGSRYEADDVAGAAHFIEHMVFKGTQRRPQARLIAEAIEGIGGVMNAFTTRELTGLYAKVAAPHFGLAFEVLADMLRRPLFDMNELEKERRVVFEEISMLYDQPDSWAGILLSAVLFSGHPLGHDIVGTVESLSNIDRERLFAFYREAYTPSNVVLTVVGAIEEEEVLRAVEEQLGDWQPARKPSYLPATGVLPAELGKVESRPVEQGHLYLALPGTSESDPKRFAYALLNAVLGDGMGSRLFQRIREELGLAYSIYSYPDALCDTGHLVIYAAVDPENALATLDVLFEELDRLRQEPVPQGELARTREYLKGKMVLGLESTSSVAAFLGQQELLDERILTVDDVLRELDQVTAEDVLALAQHYLDRKAARLSAVGPFDGSQALIDRLARWGDSA